MPRKKPIYRKNSANAKRTQEREILEYMLSIKRQVLERETLPFDVGRMPRMPYNPFTRHEYAGAFNLPMLLLNAFSSGWTDPRFVTVGKAKELGADFRGQRTALLWAPRTIREKDEDTGEEIVKGVRFRAFRVFNVEQFQNLNDLDIPPPRSRWGETTMMERIEAVREHATTNFRVRPIFSEQAFMEAPHYLPGEHQITLPPVHEYAKPERFVQSLLHEVIHATGAPSELKRFKTQYDGALCSLDRDDRAYEEIVTQFATAFLTTQYGFEHERRRSSDYILSWYRVFEDKPKVLGRAIREAMAALKYILEDNPLPAYAEDDDCELGQSA